MQQCTRVVPPSPVLPSEKNAEDFDFLAEADAAHRAQRHYAACGRLERPVVPFSVSEPCPYGALHRALGSTLKLAW